MEQFGGHMISPAVRAEIETALKTRIVSIAPLSAANNAQIYRVTCDQGRVAVKVAERGLDTEAWMLQYLRAHSALPVPDIYYSNAHIMIMEFIDAHFSIDARVQKDAARHLAALHGVAGAQYGLERDTLIGALPQPNPLSDDWVSFFATQRLLYMARAALDEGKVDAATYKMVEKLAGKLDKYLSGASAPALIHGDVWSGNVLAGRGEILAFLDPAIYYADPEVELAFISLFNTFDETFFAAYQEIRPLRAGFQDRAAIYGLYPLFVHARLFGASYARKAQKILEKFV